MAKVTSSFSFWFFVLALGLGGYFVVRSTTHPIQPSPQPNDDSHTLPLTITETPSKYPKTPLAPEQTLAHPIPRPKVFIPILMYHYITDPAFDHPDNSLYVSAQAFDSQLNWLTNHGYQSVTLDDALTMLTSRKILNPKKPVVLTFDDGYADAYTEAFPILQKYHQAGVFYIVTDFIGRPKYVTIEQVLKLDQTGMQIAAHTVHHADLAIVSPLKRYEELSDSKKTLETLLDHPIVHLAYPSGRYNDQVLILAQSLGYRTATTTHFGIAHEYSHLYQLPRVRMKEHTDLRKVLQTP